MKNKFLKICLVALIMSTAPVVWACDDDFDDTWGDYPSPGSVPSDDPVAQATYGDNTTSDTLTNITDNISGITTVDTSQPVGGNSGSGASGNTYQYVNNVDSVTENRNKLRLNAASQAIALGQRAVSLATESGNDIEKLRVEIENRDDMLRMLKGIAKLQAQHLQKTNAITAMRAKLVELNAIDNILSGDIYTTKQSSSKKSK